MVSAIPARPTRAEVGSDDSTMNMNGVRAVDKPNEARENTLSLLNVGPRGPW